ncbi:MAG: hypothetical protein JWN04_1494 [Myxococcaceae bacterium]|nr:hypothetical protein [Myxococcaceae bacterium]
MFLLLTHCGDAGGASSHHASLQTRLSSSGLVASGAGAQPKFIGGAATRGGLESLKYLITSISICETLETSGSGFRNPTGCIDLYHHDIGGLTYDPGGDYLALGDLARATTDGYVDLLSASSRDQLTGSTVLDHSHVRSYNFGLINWALPVKAKATLSMGDGSKLYTHDGHSRAETAGVDHMRFYYTEPTLPLDQAPSEEAVVLLPNGGNWFKFQSPFVITSDDIDQRREFVLDLVFDPDGIVKGFSGNFGGGQISQRAADGSHLHDITVPMLDLAPVPHRASEQVMRETYQGPVHLDGNSFDMRLELYYVEGDTTGTVYGVDVKSLLNAESSAMPPEFQKTSYLERAVDGSLTFSSYSHTPIMTGLTRVTGGAGQTHIGLACLDSAHGPGADGTFALIVGSCPSALVDVALQLTAREPVAGSIATAVGGGPDAGAPLDGGVAR